ncbi:ABC transporter permease [Flavobacterium amniphilum]|uniref:ABC transporter permease n=1 Tax=Flavobacterium amniphilum TaxID=1834035 RepID=UPI002029E72C|nr:FtsX-like permease family protein [Flavobacterium amniphilum]MCL9803893.1 ABC transporter permease [Flavobacterium amniphilum]
MNFSFYIAKRYLRTSSKSTAINIISGIASFGIIAGAMALFVVLSVFSGLKDFSLSFANDFDPDLKVMPKKGKSFLITETQKSQLQKIEGIKFYSKIIEEKVLFVYKGKEQVAMIKGVDNQYNLVNNIQKSLYQGDWVAPQTPQVVVGNGISHKLSMGLFDLNNTFEIFVPRPGKGAITNPESAFNKSNLIPVGIYAINDELDSKYVFADIQLIQELLSYKPNQISALEIKTDSLASEDAIISGIQKVFGNQVTVKNRAQLNDSLHKMLNTENTAIYLIFTLVIIMTLFTLAGAIIMIILDKKDNLRTLYNLGNTVRDIRRIFLLQGTLVTLLGGIIGIGLGMVLVLIQQHFKLVMITESLAYPVRFSMENCTIVFLTIAVLGCVASYIASSSVNKKLLD